MATINNLTLSYNEDENKLRALAAAKLGIAESKLKHFKILKKSVDARRKDNIRFVYTIEADRELKAKEKREYKRVNGAPEVVVVGFGPCGIFCALYLARHGIKPLVLERGSSIDRRVEAVERFFSSGALNANTNVQFGEGGAGTFSDGKLNTQTNSVENALVLEDFIKYGAPSDIAYLNKPHIGSDKLRSVVKAMRSEIIALGGEIRFDTAVNDIIIENSKIKGVLTKDGIVACEKLVLAIGHSSRDTFEVLKAKNVAMTKKEFAMGFRVEQLQSVVDERQYGAAAKTGLLPPSDFKLVSHEEGRGVFSFCMCPGGMVVAATSEEGGVAVNGMSNYARNMKNANSAIVTQIRIEDFPSNDVLSGAYLQRELEKKAFVMGGGDYSAPIQLVEDYVRGRNTARLGAVKPSYPCGYKLAPLYELFPSNIDVAIRKGLLSMENKLRGIASNGAVLTGVESRTSSPIRIVRGENYESENVVGLFPCGEGCGYAGGIMSAAADGIKVAEEIFSRY